MKKVLLGAAISAALFGGAAQAAITLGANNLPDAATISNSVIVYVSGSSAQSGLYETALKGTGVATDLCLPNTTYKFVDITTGGSDQVAYLCQLNTAANGSTTPNTGIPSTITKPNLLLFKRNAGGSIFGIAPIATNSAVDFLNITTNTTAATTGQPCDIAGAAKGFINNLKCSYTAGTNSTQAAPTFGLADVNPQVFTTAAQNALTTSPGISAAGAFAAPSATTYLALPGPAVTFGVVVTTKLRNALQEVQFGATSTCVGDDGEACMPSLSRGTVAAIFAAYPAPVTPLLANVSAPTAGAGKLYSWKQLTVGSSNLYDTITDGNKPGNDHLHICSRTVGSGTKAQFGIKFLGNGCNLTGGRPIVNLADHTGVNEAGQTGYTVGAAIPESTARPMVHAMAAGGDLEECMDELDQGAANSTGAFTPGTAYSTGTSAVRWAIGFQSLDKNATKAKNYRFVKLDGVSPTLANVANGTYPDWVEGVFTYNVNGLKAQDTAQKGTAALVTLMINSFTNPVNLAKVNVVQPFGTAGFLSAPSPTNPANLDGSLTATAPVNPLSHAWFYPTTASTAVVAVNTTNDCRTPMVYSNSVSHSSTGALLNNNNAQALKLQ